MKKLLLSALVAAMAFATPVFADHHKAFKITDAWLRVAPNKVAGAFFNIENMTDKNLTIVEATAANAKKTELHNHIMDKGVMKMRRVESVPLDAKSTQKFNPHGYHLMMFKLDKMAYMVGKEVEVELTLSDETKVKAMFEVRPFGKMKMKMGDKKMDHSKMDMNTDKK